MIIECKNCGGRVEFSPKNKGCICVNCGSIFPIKYNLGMKKYEFSQADNLNVTSNNDIKSFKCTSCGATVLVNKNEIKTTCMYCGNSSIAQVGENKMININSVIPFSFNKDEAVLKFNNSVMHSFFANKKVLKGVNIENFQGIYVNAFVFDLNVNAIYNGVLSYTETYRTKKGESRSRVVYRNVNGSLNKLFNNLAIESNSHINQEQLNQILPFDYSQAVEFKKEFTYGYAFEYHDEQFSKCFSRAETIVKNNIKSSILKKHGCDRIESLNLFIDYVDKKYNYCLLPVYFVNKKYKDKNYQVLMNGQTGALSSLPKNVGKIFLMILLIFGAAAGIIALIVFLSNLG